MTTRTLLTAVLVVAGLLSACDKDKIDAAKEKLRSETGTAESRGQVRSIYVKANSCEGGIRAGLAERGFTIARDADDVDGVLVVEVSHGGRNLDNIPSFGGVGNKASYSARLLGAGGKTLFSTSGSEGSINMEELCEDIGDNIGDRLR